MYQLKRSIIFGVVLLSLFGVLMNAGSISAENSLQQQSESTCTIPDSGPWPPCATGGNTQPAPADPNECIIPESGPWPPCATNGGGVSNPPTEDQGCIIPPSGPWPACATGQAPSPSVPSDPAPPATATDKTRKYGLGEVRAIFVPILNSFYGEEGENPVGGWQNDSSISFEEGVMHIGSTRRLNEWVDFINNYRASFHVENGQPVVDTLLIDRSGHEVTGEDLILHATHIRNEFRDYLFSQLSYREVISIVLTESEMIVTYR